MIGKSRAEEAIEQLTTQIKAKVITEVQAHLVDEWNKSQKRFFDQLETYRTKFKEDIIEELKDGKVH